jgi:transcriptional regulator with GAF, ATPase, and Fis domain
MLCAQMPDTQDAMYATIPNRETARQGGNAFDAIIGKSGALKSVLQEVSLVADTDTTVLIQGETGTGKELIARSPPRLEPPL